MPRWKARAHVSVDGHLRRPGVEFEATFDQVGVLVERGLVLPVADTGEATGEPREGLEVPLGKMGVVLSDGTTEITDEPLDSTAHDLDPADPNPEGVPDASNHSEEE